MENIKEKKNIHFAWFIFISICLLQGATLGLINTTNGLYITPVSTEFGIETSTFTLWTMFMSAGTMISLPFMNRICSRVNLKLFILVCAIIGSTALISLSFSTSVYWWYAVGFILGIGNTFLCTGLTPILLSNWFKSKFTTVVGISSAVGSFFGVIGNPIGSSIIESMGWRTWPIIQGVCLLIFSLPFALFFAYYDPSKKGMLPYGATEEDMKAEEARILAGEKEEPVKITFKDYGLKIFLIVALTLICSWCPGYFPLLPTYVVSIGIPMAIGATMVSIEIAGTMTAKILIGPVMDKLGVKKTQILLSVIPICGFIIYLLTTQTLPMYICSFMCGLFMVTVSVVTPTVSRNALGRKAYAKITPIISMGTMLFNSYAQTAYAKLAAIFGTYRVMFVICICIICISFVLVCVLDSKRASDMK